MSKALHVLRRTLDGAIAAILAAAALYLFLAAALRIDLEPGSEGQQVYALTMGFIALVICGGALTLYDWIAAALNVLGRALAIGGAVLAAIARAACFRLGRLFDGLGTRLIIGRSGGRDS